VRACALALTAALALAACTRTDHAAAIRDGEAIFFGKGRCAECHVLGGRGSAVRGPALDGFGARADARGRERAAAKGGAPLTAGEYVVESLVDPGAFAADGVPPIMPDVSRAPIGLDRRELDAVARFLLARGGDPAARLDWPAAVDDPARRAPAPASFAEGGDVARGRAIFHDLEGAARCVGCHGLEPGGSEIGPDLRAIAAIQPPEAIRVAVLEPNREIVAGYHQTIVTTKDELILIGIVKNETDDAFDLVVRKTAVATETTRLAKADVAERAPGQLSIMPNNYSELLTPEELRDLFAFLLTLRGDGERGATRGS